MAAAVRGGIDLELDLAVRNGSLHLPTLGTYTVKTTSITDLGLRAHSGEATVHRGLDSSGEPRWRALNHLACDGLTVALEDADPYRDCHHWPVDPGVSPGAVSAWRSLFTEAWRMILRDHAGYAPAMSAGLSTIVPLVRSDAGQISATARRAFGSVAIALPDTAEELALLMVHEFQHVKLGALLDLFDLYDPEDTRVFDAPWRPDKRPLEAILQGTYAHAAVADVWRARWRRDRARSRADSLDNADEDDAASGLLAGARYILWRERTADVVETLTSSGSLTALGTRLVEATGERVAAWQAEPMPWHVHEKARVLARAGSAGS
jgi:uncharacterized protein